MSAQTVPQDQPQLTTPPSGAAVQGSYTITGSTGLPDFKYAEISFNYSNAPSKNWFLIQQMAAPVKSGFLAVWDTTTIADGIYQLRLQVYLTNGKILETFASGIRVRNYTPIETSTVSPKQSLAATQTVEHPTPLPVTVTPRDTPTRLPTNPVPVPASSLVSSLGWGAGVVFLFFVIFFLYQSIHNQDKS